MDFESFVLKIETNPNNIAMHTSIFHKSKSRLLRACLLAALGCLSSAWALAQSGPASAVPTNQAPTYLRDVLPIIMGKCSRCHNQEARFVYDWLDYRTAYADRWEIRR